MAATAQQVSFGGRLTLGALALLLAAACDGDGAGSASLTGTVSTGGQGGAFHMASFSADMSTDRAGLVSAWFSAEGDRENEEVEVTLSDLDQTEGAFTVSGADPDQPTCRITYAIGDTFASERCTAEFAGGTSLASPGRAIGRVTAQGYVTADLSFDFYIPGPDEGDDGGGVGRTEPTAHLAE